MSNTVLNNKRRVLSQPAGDLPVLQPVASIAPIQNREQLLSAFEVFNNVSSQLTDTYRDMEHQVGLLDAQLHRVAEQRLQELQEKERITQRLEELLNLLPAGVLVLDKQGIVSQCNPAAKELLGTDLAGKLWRDVIQDCFSPQLDDGHEISLLDGRRINMTTRSLQGEPGQLILLTDLSETRKLQKRVDRHRRLSEMGRMMSSLAHQIRTPLSAAMLYAGHLCESELTSAQHQRFSQKVLSRLVHMEQQVKDMLIFVKGDVKLTDTISSADLCSQLEAAMEACIHKSSTVYKIINCDPDVMLQCNCETMVGALMNLINNAIESSENLIQLTITVALINNDQLEISVQDNGPGIPKDIQKNLEEPFFTTKSQGTGLGLAVVRAVAHAHHGKFLLMSELHVGSCAQLVLPIVTAHESITGR